MDNDIIRILQNFHQKIRWPQNSERLSIRIPVGNRIFEELRIIIEKVDIC